SAASRPPRRRGATAQDAVDDEELFLGQDDMGSIPAQDGRQDVQRRGHDEDAARNRRRPAEHEPDHAAARGRQRSYNRPREHDPVPPLVDEDLLFHGIVAFDRWATNPGYGHDST